ncbi:MAG: T9SS type A sorting domain-containing protein, partial [Bacteroidales bacterium]|nr:T9SS type A sorting domain-containing protein [Bacteroidales bacterium]
IQSELKGGDNSNLVYYTEISGLNSFMPLTLQVDAACSGPTIVYSYDNVNWQKVEIDSSSNFIIPFNSSSVYVAHTYPYTYSDMIADVDSISGFSYVDVYNMAISEEGRPVKLVRITENCTNNAEKELIWILGRIHAFEAPGNYTVAGMLDFFTSNHPAAKRLREEAIIYIVPMMDVDQVYNGGSGKNQSPIDFNQDWISLSHQSHWNAIKKAKIWIDSTAQLNPFRVFIDSHSPLPYHHSLFYFTYNVDHHISNSKFVRETIQHLGNYHINELLFSLNTMYSQDYIIDNYDNPFHFNITMETGFNKRTDNVAWTKNLYLLNGELHAQAVSNYIHGLVNTGDILIDNNDSEQVVINGNWQSDSSILGYFMNDYLYADNQDPASVSFNATIPASDTYEIFTRWVSNPGFATNAVASFDYSGGTSDFTLDMSLRGGNWVALDTFQLMNGERVSLTISNPSANGIVIADGLRISKVIECQTTSIQDCILEQNNIDFSNYPNPFNSETTISFTIPVENKIELIVFNIIGQKIKTLVNSKFIKGKHSVIWDGTNVMGEPVGSGIYFCIFNVNNKPIKTKKIMLLK